MPSFGSVTSVQVAVATGAVVPGCSESVALGYDDGAVVVAPDACVG
jgi:hypothetical protein